MSKQSPLGREVAYPRGYDPTVLFAMPRSPGREALGVRAATLPFSGFDRWHAYELSWLDLRGKPKVATATITVPASSPHLIESKSLKLYLASFASHRLDHLDALLAMVAADLSRTADAAVTATPGVPTGSACVVASGVDGGIEAATLDDAPIDIDDYGPPNPTHLASDARDDASEVLRSDLLKSNCPVTGQPDWASVRIGYRGPRIGRIGLLRYLVSFREHAEFHEQCVERIFVDLMARCRPQALSVEARYTRRGGLDINPWRATPGYDAPAPGRDLRQ
ncbi:MAG: NADPH-dependent 7-cyano-7-deazaguanine reductase QueF [Burkholderiaceae bacterium]